MKSSVTYNYNCPCGHTNSKTDELKAVGAFIRVIINPAISCPQCHRLLQASVTIEYQQSQENALAEMANICNELGMYD